MPKLYTGAEIVFKCLEDQKVEHIFGYPGGAVLPIYDELKNLFMIGLNKQNLNLKKMNFLRYTLIFLDQN